MGEANPTRKRCRKDRKDAWFVQDADTMHKFMPYLMPQRTENEAMLGLEIDLTAINRYLEEKNAQNPEFRYTFFHVLCGMFAKTAVLRPKLNRFYSGYRLYERKDVILAFTIKKKFSDDGEEGLALVKIDRESDKSPVQQVHDQVEKIVTSARKENKNDGATDDMDTLVKLPRPILRLAMRFLRWTEYHGIYPKSLMREDPYYSTFFVSNLGSIKMNADYHHLTEWGTNSFFIIIGEKHPQAVYDENGNVEMHDVLKLGMTVDERIADGYYYANSLRLMKHLVNHPELLDLPVTEPVEVEDVRKDKKA